MAKRISIINFKGGVGKTTIALHLAAGLVRYHDNQRVLLIDVDHQSSLSVVMLGNTRWEQSVTEGRTINAVFEHFTKPGQSMPDGSIITRSPLGERYSTLDIIPAELELDDTELELGATTFGDPTESTWRKLTLLSQWIADNGIDDLYDYIIFDCPPATKLVTRNAIACSHGYAIPIIPDDVSSRGMPHLVNLLSTRIDTALAALAEDIRRRRKPVVSTFCANTQLTAIIVAMIQKHGPAYSGYTDVHTRNLRSLQSNPSWSGYLVEPYIEIGEGIRRALSRGRTVYDSSDDPNIRNRNYVNIYKQLTASLKRNIDAI